MKRDMGGLTTHEDYEVYRNMIRRCYDPLSASFEDYGLRGIKVCYRWKGLNGLKHFLEDMGDRPNKNYQLDRKDNDQGYSPWNCRWCTRKENNLNRNSTHWITFRGKTLCMQDWAKVLNINYTTLSRRLNQLNWSVEKAFTTDQRKYKR